MLALLLTAALIGVFVTRHESRLAAGIIAVVLFLTMPVVWLGATRSFPQSILMPFVVLFLLAFGQFASHRRPMWATCTGVVLAAMIYLHYAGIVVAASLACVAVVVLLLDRSMQAAIALVLGGVVAALPGIIGVLLRPASVHAAIVQHGLYDANRFNLLQGAREMTTWLGFTVRSEAYWDSFNPAFLFLGTGGLVDSVRHPRMFWLPFAIPFVIGIVRYVQTPTLMARVVLGALIVSPCVVAILAQPPEPSRLMVMAPVAAIIAAGAFTPRAAGSSPRASR